MKITVLAGGNSTEREVSLASGQMVYDALKRNGHEVTFLDSLNPQILSRCVSSDIVFLALHGANGEDGRIQATFDLAGIKYTGTGYLGAALSMDKKLSKILFQHNHIPTPKGYALKIKDYPAYAKDITYPAVIKTTCGGSSIGVYIVENENACQSALKDVSRYGDEIIIEEYIKGREFSVGILEGTALPVIEIAPKHGFYDYKNKYEEGAAIETCPANLSPKLTRKMQDYAEKAYQALQLEAYARVDFLLRGDDIFCLEANALPGLTKTSLLPQEAAVLGMNFDDLCEKIVEVSLRK